MGLTGREAVMAFGKYGTGSWGVATSVTKGVYFASTGGLKLEPERVNDEAFGQAFLGKGELGDVKAPAITLTGRSRYNDHSYILDALCMGSPAITLSNSASGQTASWTHTVDLARTIEGLGATIAVDKVHYVEELTSAVITGFSEKVGNGGVMDKAYTVLGSKPTNASATNTRSIVNSASFVSLGDRVFRNQGTFRLNPQGGGSLSGTDALTVEQFEFTLTRPMDASNAFGQDYIIKPADNGFPMVSLALTLPRMNANECNSFYASLQNNYIFKGDLTYLGAFINSTDKYKRLFQFPHLELDDFSTDVTGANQVKPTVKFTAKLAATSPTGMAFVNPFRLTLVSAMGVVAF